MIDEVPDLSVVKQFDNLACGAACGEMVLTDRGVVIPQQRIAQEAGQSLFDYNLLKETLSTLDSSGSGTWSGGYLQGANDPVEATRLVHTLNNTGSWVAQFWETGKSIGHFVVVEGLDDVGRVMIRDPWDGTRYVMNMEDFLNTWDGIAVFLR